jgi:surfeit locus 1 family protein
VTRKGVVALIAFNLAATLAVAGLVALAVWQVHRRAYKLDLIARVEARVHAVPTPAPGPGSWAQVSAAADEYRRVTVTGNWLEDRPTLVKAVTELGDGYWVIAPIAQDDGTTILVNRGFVPSDKRDPASWRPPGPKPVTVTGLLRMSEPGGAFLRANDPASNRWFSRDVAAVAASRGLAKVAPYFIDAERAPGESGLPVAGLTVIAFSNNHLVYALTWGALALMAAAGAIFVNLDLLRPSWFRPRRVGLHES